MEKTYFVPGKRSRRLRWLIFKATSYWACGQLKYWDVFAWVSAKLRLFHSAHMQLTLNPKCRIFYIACFGSRLNPIKTTLNLMLSGTTLAILPGVRSWAKSTCLSLLFLSHSLTMTLKGLELGQKLQYKRCPTMLTPNHSGNSQVINKIKDTLQNTARHPFFLHVIDKNLMGDMLIFSLKHIYTLFTVAPEICQVIHQNRRSLYGTTS